MKPLFIVPLLLITQARSTLAANYNKTSEAACTDVDYRSSFPMPIRDQGGVSWCYANAAADYLQYTYRLPVQISAADIAISYSQTFVSDVMTFFKRVFNAEDRLEPPQTGFIDLAVKHVTPQGYCPESVLPSDQWPRIETTTQNHSQVKLLQAIMDLYSLQAEVKAGAIASVDTLPWYYNLKNITQAQFYALLKNNSQNKLLPALRNVVCQNDRLPYPNHPVKRHFSLRTKKMFNKINSSFDSAEMPSTIDFFSGIFTNYDHYRKTLDDLHTVLLYGRKFDSKANECVYLVKDSHGTNCSRYDPKIPCEGGYVWLPESKLYDVITSFFILERL